MVVGARSRGILTLFLTEEVTLPLIGAMLAIVISVSRYEPAFGHGPNRAFRAGCDLDGRPVRVLAK